MSYNRMTSRDKIGICVRRMNSGEKNEELAFQENEFCCFSLWFIFFYFAKKSFVKLEKYHIQPSQG